MYEEKLKILKSAIKQSIFVEERKKFTRLKQKKKEFNYQSND